MTVLSQTVPSCTFYKYIISPEPTKVYQADLELCHAPRDIICRNKNPTHPRRFLPKRSDSPDGETRC